MLVKKIENGTLIECLFNSSNVLSSKYDKATQELTVVFNAGTQYKYKGVRMTDYTRFEISDSQGKELNGRIKQYPAERLTDVNTTTLVREIHKYTPKEMSKEEKQLIATMEALLIASKNKSSIDVKDLENVEYFINKVKESKNAVLA
jgi:Fe-S cluster assembly ATPase SufC